MVAVALIVAQRNGVEVDGITLWLLGGIARLRGEAPTPGVDFRISVIGPVTSLVVAGVLARRPGWPSWPTSTVWW